MKINHIVNETTTSGSVATVDSPIGATQSRGNPSIYGGKKAGSMFKGKKTSKPFANSLNEAAMKDLAYDLQNMKPAEFLKKYGKSREEMKAAMSKQPQPAVNEAELQEDDIIMVPGQGKRLKPGLISKADDRTDHEVEMARSDLFSAAQNAQKVFAMIKDMSEEEGLDGWVQEKIIKANDYLNTIREYLEGKQLQHESKFGSGVIGNGAMGESSQRGDSLVTDALKIMRGSEVSDAVRALTTVLGNREYNSRRGFYNFYIKQMIDMYRQQGIAEGEDEGIRPQGKILKRLRDIAIMSPTLTFQNFRQSGKEAIITDAMMACKIMKRHYLQNKNQPTAQFIYNLENEIYDFMRGRKLDTPDGNSYTMDLSDLSRGTLGKMQFQTKEDVTEGAKVDRMVKHVAQSEKKLGKSKDEAENIAWATANKRGMLDNKNKKA